MPQPAAVPGSMTTQANLCMFDRRQLLKAATFLPAGLAFTAAAGAGSSELAALSELRFIVSSVPGGAVDLVARVLALALSQSHKLPVIVMNVEGAAGEIALKRLVTDPPDGKTWLLAQEAIITINPSYYARASADILDGIVPVAQVATSNVYMLVRADDSINSFSDLLNEARSGTAPLAYGSGGVGSLHHLSMEDLSARLDLNLLHVPYKSNAPAAQALVRGEIRVLMAGTSTLPLIQAGRLKMIAVTSPKRMPAYPEVPALSEFVPGFQPTNWFGFFARKGVSETILNEMRNLLQSQVESEDIRRSVRERSDAQLAFASGRAFMDLILGDRQRYVDIVRRLKSSKTLIITK